LAQLSSSPATHGESRGLAPLLSASPAIQFRAFAVVAASGLGLVQLTASKGPGWIWVVLKGVMSVSACFIHGMRLWGQWSPIHLLAIFTLTVLPDRGLVCTQSRGSQTPQRHGDPLHRRTGNRRRAHVVARAHHACRGVGLTTARSMGNAPCRNVASQG